MSSIRSREKVKIYPSVLLILANKTGRRSMSQSNRTWRGGTSNIKMRDMHSSRDRGTSVSRISSPSDVVLSFSS